MPSEPLPWDRRDFRKHDRSSSTAAGDPRLGAAGFGGGGGGGPHRWRDQHHAPPPYYHHNNRHQQQQQQQQQRWYSDFRSNRPFPPGHGKQGGWHMYSDDAGHGYVPFGSRYGNRNLEDENCRPFGSRSDGRYSRSNRENRASFSQKEWKAPSSEIAASPSDSGKPTPEINNQRSIENNQTFHNGYSNKSVDSSSHPLDYVNPSNKSQSPLKEPHWENGCSSDVLTSTGQKLEKENGLESMDRKPLKWPRSGSLSSKGNSFSHSSISKSVGVDSIEPAAEVPQKNETPVQLPSAAAAITSPSAPISDASASAAAAAPASASASASTVCVKFTAPAPLDETSSRKKPRLGWGEGLAKYEKKRVEGPDDCAIKDGMVDSNTESAQTHTFSLLDGSPKIASLSICASPATPSSVACSSSPGSEEKDSSKAANVDHDTANVVCSPSIVSQTHYNGPKLSLENLELTSIASLSTSLNEFLQSMDPSSVETDFEPWMKKLLMCKVDILKAVEITESEVDSLETELKSLIAEPRSCCPNTAFSSLLPGQCHLKPCEDQVTAIKFTVRPAPLQVVSSGDNIIENTPVAQEHEHGMLNDEDLDSPGSATSKFVAVPPTGDDIFPSETAECKEGLADRDGTNSCNLDEKCSHDGFSGDENAGHVDTRQLSVTNGSKVLAQEINLLSDLRNVYDSIMASNKDSASRAFEPLDKLFSAQGCHFDIIAPSVSSSQRYLLVKDKFLMKKKFLRFKEKVVTLKFKVFQHFWKEGRLVSMRKLRKHSQKKFDLSRTSHKKNRLFCRSRISSSGGSPRIVQADEVMDFVNELLSEVPFTPLRDTLKMPALVLDKEMKMSRFISSNGLVEDPFALEKERCMINTWTSEEREVFIDKLATFGKDFQKIASFLDQKTIADCIEFYYKNHKSECFEKAWKKPDFMKQRKSQSTMYLVASGKRWNREANAASLDILGAASVIAANGDGRIEIQQKSSSRFVCGSSTSYKAMGDDGPSRRSNSLDMYNNEREAAAADVLAGICGSISSEAMSSCITSSVDPADGYQDWRYQRLNSSTMRPLTPEVTQDVDDECSDESCGELESIDWTDEEKSLFIQAVSSYGKDYEMISRSVRTRSQDQCKLFYGKARKRFGLDLIQPGSCNDASDDVNGGGSDIEDAAVGTGSVDNAGGSGCKMEDDLAPPDVKLKQESDVVATQNLKPDSKISEKNGLCPLVPVVAEPFLNNLLMDDEKPVADLNVDVKERDDLSGVHVAVQETGTAGVSFNTQSVQEEEEGGQCWPDRPGEAENRASVGVSSGSYGEENERRVTLSPKDNFDNKELENKDANSSGVGGISLALSETDTQLAQNVSHPLVGASTSILVDKVSGCQQKTVFDSCSAVTPVMPLLHNDNLASAKVSTLFSVPIKYQKSPCNGLSTVGSKKTSDEHLQKIVRTGNSEQYVSGYSMSDPVESSSQILRGYPVSVNTLKEINGSVNCKRSVSLQNVTNGVLHSDQHMEFSLQRCNGSRQESKVPDSLYPSQEQSRHHCRPHSASSSDVDKPSRNGDLKLFGKVLITSNQKPNFCEEQGRENVNVDSARSESDFSNHIGSENIPVRSYSFCDGSRSQTGFSPLPDSTLFVNKYPVAFGNYAAPTVKLEQLPLPLHDSKSNGHSLNGLSVFSSGELSSSSSNGVAGYQVVRNREVQPFTMDMKQPQDMIFSEMQKRNGFDEVSGMQQNARGTTVGINVVGRGGILVGGPCSGVSDPVAAIKMHYAKAEQFGMQSGNLIKDDGTWRCNGGDVGR